MRPWLTSGRLSRGLTAQRLLIQGPAVQLLLKTTSAETAEHVGIQKLKQFHMVNIDMFRHPKYYKELRKLRNKSDQVISKRTCDGESERAPGPGLRPQAASRKQQASSTKLLKQQATSVKPQA